MVKGCETSVREWVREVRSRSLVSRFPARGILLVFALMGWMIVSDTSTPNLGAQPFSSEVEELPEVEVIEIFVGQSRVFKMPWMLRRAEDGPAISVPGTEIADVDSISEELVQIEGKKVGSMNLILWGEKEGEIWRGRINVLVDLQPLKDDLHGMFPQASLDVRLAHGVHVISGTFQSAENVDALNRFLVASELKFVDMTRLAGPQQVLIEVRMAEVNRTAIRAMGINAFRTGRNFFGASRIGGVGSPLNPIDIIPSAAPILGAGNDGIGGSADVTFGFSGVSVSPAVTLLAGLPRADLEFFIQALVENQYLRLLAEPTLVALSGETGSFLAGGEFPIPIVQSGGVGGTSISVEFKEFGVALEFLPTVLGNGRIRLKIAPEVSALSDVGSISIEGFTIPTLLTRRAETTLELKSGQSFTIAGLLNQSNTARISQVPYLGEIPILGQLFRSVRYQRDETELIVIVTVSLIEPLNGTSDRLLPGVAHLAPDDWEFFYEGRIEGAGTNKSSLGSAPEIGELGFDRLRGPGAWATHDETSRSVDIPTESGAPNVRTNQPGTQSDAPGEQQRQDSGE